MILRRLGNKKAIAHKIIAHFPPHRVYIEPFFGAGGIFFYKQRAQYNFLNDLDADVANLWDVYFNRKDELIEAIELAPYHEKLFQDWQAKQETEPIQKALRFLFLSNFGYMGMNSAMRFNDRKSKEYLLKQCKKTLLNVSDVQFLNADFRKVLNKIQINDNKTTLIYCDPPYLTTTNNYSIGKNGWSEQDTIDLFDLCIKSKAKFAISEFDNPTVLDLAKKHGLNIIEIGDRKTMQNKATKREILITNYTLNNTLF